MIKKYFVTVFLCMLIFCLVIYSKNAINAASNALEVCMHVLLPSLFPFFVLSKLFISSGGTKILGNMLNPFVRILFGINKNGAAPFVLGIISGYPVGAKCVCELYNNRLLTKSEAENLLCFCNNSGPLFVISAVGATMFSNFKIGILLYVVHVTSAIIVGMILKKICPPVMISSNSKHTIHQPSYNYFTTAVEDSVNTTLNIFGYVIFFAVIIDIITSLGIVTLASDILSFLNIPRDIVESLFLSTTEITTGIKKLSESSSFPLSYTLVLCSTVIGWGGISVHMQVKGIISKTNLSFKKYLFGKFLHSVISFIVSGFVFERISIAHETFLNNSNTVTQTNNASSFLIVISFLIILAYIVKILSVKPPHCCSKHACKNRPQCINGK